MHTSRQASEQASKKESKRESEQATTRARKEESRRGKIAAWKQEIKEAGAQASMQARKQASERTHATRRSLAWAPSGPRKWSKWQEKQHESKLKSMTTPRGRSRMGARTSKRRQGHADNRQGRGRTMRLRLHNASAGNRGSTFISLRIDTCCVRSLAACMGGMTRSPLSRPTRERNHSRANGLGIISWGGQPC